MKNKKSRKPASSKKKTNVKAGVTVVIVIVLIMGAIAGTLAIISKGFTKPVDEWFSDKATVTPLPDTDQDKDSNPSNDGSSTLPDYERIKLASKVISPEETCVVNYYRPDYSLIKSVEIKGGDMLPVSDIEEYLVLTSNKIVIPDVDSTSDTLAIINGKAFSVVGYNAPLATILYPYAADGNIEYLLCESYFGVHNDKYEYCDNFNINVGDSIDFISIKNNNIPVFCMDNFLCIRITQEDALELQASLDVVNIIVLN